MKRAYYPYCVAAGIFLPVAAFAIFFMLPELAKRRFRDYRRIPTDSEIVYLREAGLGRTRFCLIQHPASKYLRPLTPEYRPISSGALGIMQNVQREFGVPDSKMPDQNKHSITYSGGENENRPDGWMFLDLADSETKQEWIFED
jgi:hypothetical protein